MLSPIREASRALDINVEPVYSNFGFTGAGVITAVVDSGLEIAHEDLAANVVSGGSWNFLNGTTDPTSTATTGDHGTSVAGLIAMAQNMVGGIGVAPSARLKGFNFIASSQSTANFVASLGGSTANPNSSDMHVFNQRLRAHHNQGIAPIEQLRQHGQADPSRGIDPPPLDTPLFV